MDDSNFAKEEIFDVSGDVVEEIEAASIPEQTKVRDLCASISLICNAVCILCKL
jgi:hypothetical protein